jgi:hypothetical protein
MKRSFLSGAIVAVATVAPALAATYSLVDKIVGGDFYNAFEWQNIYDPSDGRVYVLNFFFFVFLLF